MLIGATWLSNKFCLCYLVEFFNGLFAPSIQSVFTPPKPPARAFREPSSCWEMFLEWKYINFAMLGHTIATCSILSVVVQLLKVCSWDYGKDQNVYFGLGIPLWFERSIGQWWFEFSVERDPEKSLKDKSQSSPHKTRSRQMRVGLLSSLLQVFWRCISRNLHSLNICEKLSLWGLCCFCPLLNRWC